MYRRYAIFMTMKKMLVAIMEELLAKHEGMGINRVNLLHKEGKDGGMRVWIRPSPYWGEESGVCFMQDIQRIT